LFLVARTFDAACANAAEGPTPMQQVLHTALHTALAAARAEDTFDRFWDTLPIDTPTQQQGMQCSQFIKWVTWLIIVIVISSS